MYLLGPSFPQRLESLSPRLMSENCQKFCVGAYEIIKYPRLNKDGGLLLSLEAKTSGVSQRSVVGYLMFVLTRAH